MDQDTRSLADIVTSSCLETLSGLPKKGTPLQGKEWTVLAGVVEENMATGTFTTVSLGTGTKCIGPSKMRGDGKILNDSHAEVIARRAFRRYVYYHLEKVYTGEDSHIFSTPDPKTGTCRIRHNLQYHFYISHTPCGDASIIPVKDCTDMTSDEKLAITREIQHKRKLDSDSESDAKKPKLDIDGTTAYVDILRTGGKPVTGEKQDPKHCNGDYHIPGLLRNKPGRGEATISMSCSDKLAKWNAVGYLGALLSLVIPEPLYMSSIVISKCPYSEQCMRRALWDRISHVNLKKPYHIRMPRLLFSGLKFPFANVGNMQPCARAVSWCKVPDDSLEVLVNGFKLGATKKQIESAAAQSKISRMSLFQCFMKVQGFSQKLTRCDTLSDSTLSYRDYKNSAESYQAAWADLRRSAFTNWIVHDHKLDNFFIK